MATTQSWPEFAWTAEMPLLTNRFFLYDALKLFFWTAISIFVLLFVTFALGGSLEHLPPILEMFGIILAVLVVLFALIALVFFGNHYPMAFRITPRGIGWMTLSRRARAADRVAIVAGILSGNPGAAGAGMIAASQESGWLQWGQLCRVKKHPDVRVISLMNTWRVVIRLYCTPENYAYVAQLLDWYFSATHPYPSAVRR